MNTTRDNDVIEFIEKFKIASTSTIAEVFFPSKISCYRRLQYITKSKELKRIRDNVSSEYLYYKKIPKQLKHCLLVSDFYRELHRRSEIVDFSIEPKLGDIIPDALFAYKINGNIFLSLLEVEISNKGFNYSKYNRFYMSQTYKNYFPVMPTIFVVGNKVKIPDQKNIKYNIIDTKFSSFNLTQNLFKEC